MNSSEEIRLTLQALREGLVDAGRLSEAASAWTPSEHPSFLLYLADLGLLSADQLRELRDGPTVAHAQGEADPTATARPPGPTASAVAADGTGDWAGPPPANATAPPPFPDGRYRIRRLHQVGGLGQVWLAEDTTLGRDVAVKTIRPERAADLASRARFVREARVTGGLEHPCIVPLYDLMPAGDGAGGPCYAMRFLAGYTLATATAAYHAGSRADPLALSALLDALVSVCRAVAFAHTKGVLHRDLKGQNVVLGDFGEVFLVDWGLAEKVAAARPGPVVGTPGFIAPEVADNGPPSVASDVYSLGAMLYVILTGTPPYNTGTPLERIRQAVEADPPWPRSVVPSAPPALDAICRKAMARNPADRYASADALAVDLRRFLADEPVSAYREPWPARAVRYARRHRTGAAVAAVFLVTAVVALAVSTAVVWRERERTAAQQKLAEKHFDTARALAFDLSRGITEIETGQSNPTPSDEARKEALDKARAVFDQFRADRPDDTALQEQAAALHWFAANLSQHRDYFGAHASYAAAVKLQEDLAARFPDDPARQDRLAEVLRDRAFLELRMGSLKAAAATFDRSVGIAEGQRSKAPDTWTRRTLGLGEIGRAVVAFALGRFDESARAAARAANSLDGLKNAPPPARHPYDPLYAAMAVHRAAMALREQKKYPEAMAAHDDAVARMKALAGPQANRDVRHWYGEVRRERARTAADVPERRAAAAEELADVIRGARQLVEEHPHTAAYREGLAAAHLCRGELSTLLGKPDEAADDLTKSLAESQELLARHGPLSASLLVRGEALLALGRVRASGGRNDDAAAQWVAAVAVFEDARVRDPDNALHRRGLAEAERAMKSVKK